MTEQRYRAVLEVQAGVPVTEVAERFGVSPAPGPQQGEALHAKQIGQGMVDHPGTLEAPAGSQALMRRPLKNLPVPLSTTLPAGSNTVNS